MIILEKPYVSEYLIKTIKENSCRVFDNEVARKYFQKEELTFTVTLAPIRSAPAS